MQIACYIRVSTQEQSEHNISIPAQKTKLMSYCTSRDWTIHDFYVDEGYSGKDFDRPELLRLINDAKSKKFDCVLVWKLDRLSRRQQHVLYLVEEVLLSNGIDFASVTENFDTSKPMGRAMIGIMAVFGQLERETIIERTKMGKEEAARQGRYLGGRPLYGYKYDSTNRRLEINPMEADIVKFIYAEYIKGDRGYSYIAEQLNQRQIPSPSGRSFWYDMTVARILQNATYSGYIVHGSNLYKGKHAPIVIEREWRQVQRIIKSNRTRFKPIGLSDGHGLLKGIIYCGECGAKMRFKSAGTRNGTSRFFYVCYSVDKRAKHMIVDPECQGTYQNAEKLEKIVAGQVMQYRLEPSLVRVEAEEILKDQSNPSKLMNFKYASKELADIKRLINKWKLAFESDTITPTDFCDRVKVLQEKKVYIENQIVTYEQGAAEQCKDLLTSGELIEHLKALPEIWAIAHPEEKRCVILDIIKRIIVYKDGTVSLELQ
ncbi:MAG: recombinase family protein [Negativicutes bacterium]|nr:recombinase family protein [Negativicutes bacterium]